MFFLDISNLLLSLYYKFKDIDVIKEKFEDLNPKLQGFIMGVGITLLSVFVLGTYLVYL